MAHVEVVSKFDYDAVVMALEKAVKRTEELETEVLELRRATNTLLSENEKLKTDLGHARKKLVEQKKVFTAAAKQADKMAREELNKQLAEASKREVSLIVKLHQYEPPQHVMGLVPPDVGARAQAMIEAQKRRAEAASAVQQREEQRRQSLAAEQQRQQQQQALAMEPYQQAAVGQYSGVLGAGQQYTNTTALGLPPPGPGIQDLRWPPQHHHHHQDFGLPELQLSAEVATPAPRKRRRHEDTGDTRMLVDENGKKLSEPHKRCKYPGCTRYASFGFYEEGGPRPRQRCGEHKLPGMASCKNTICQHPGCKTQPSYGDPSEKAPSRCKAHMVPGMVSLREKRCGTDGCQLRPSFGFEGVGAPEKCRKHALEGMKRLYQDHCAAPGCERAPSYGWLDDIKASVCLQHKQPGQYNLKALGRCGHPLCEARPSWGFPAEPADASTIEGGKRVRAEKAKPTRCPSHAVTGMVDFKTTVWELADAVAQIEGVGQLEGGMGQLEGGVDLGEHLGHET